MTGKAEKCVCSVEVCGFNSLQACSHYKLLWWQLEAPLLPSLLLSLGPHLRQTRENVVLFLEGTATCSLKGGMEPEWVVISAITSAHVTGLAQGSCGVNHRRPAAFPFQLQKG